MIYQTGGVFNPKKQNHLFWAAFTVAHIFFHMFKPLLPLEFRKFLPGYIDCER